MLTRRKALKGLGCLLAAGFPLRPLRAETVALRVAYRDELDPLWRPDGPAFRVLAEVVVRRAGIDLTYMPLPWARAIAYAAEGQADALLTAFSSKSRDHGRFLVTETPLMRVAQGLVYSRTHPDRARLDAATSLEALKPLSYVYVRTDGYAREMIQDYGSTVEMPTLEAMVKGVAARRGDFAMLQYERLTALVAAFRLENELVVRALDWNRAGWFFGLRRTFPAAGEIIARIDASARAAWADGVLEQLGNQS